MKLASLGLAALLMRPPGAALPQYQAPGWDRADRTGSITPRRERRAPARVYRDGSIVAGPQLCVPWCPSDLNPCDPPEFKVADGRCSWDDY